MRRMSASIRAYIRSSRRLLRIGRLMDSISARMALFLGSFRFRREVCALEGECGTGLGGFHQGVELAFGVDKVLGQELELLHVAV